MTVLQVILTLIALVPTTVFGHVVAYYLIQWLAKMPRLQGNKASVRPIGLDGFDFSSVPPAFNNDPGIGYPLKRFEGDA